ncbi:hypothetical protein RUM44_010634 [Polyplax serrata]|uniref:Uncharacterized protein n=1 Tax=Polyplax serrata TaxID=468196 RepID=A0ABR1AMQ8_POLSC
MAESVKFTLSSEMKFNFMKNLKFRFPPEEIYKFLRHRSMLFHLLTFLWHMLLNYQTLAGVFYILFNRMDLVNKTCGFGIQYITIWNQEIIRSSTSETEYFKKSSSFIDAKAGSQRTILRHANFIEDATEILWCCLQGAWLAHSKPHRFEC